MAGCVVSLAMRFLPCERARLMAAVSSVVPSPLAPKAWALRKAVALCLGWSSQLAHAAGTGGAGEGGGGGGGGGPEEATHETQPLLHVIGLLVLYLR